MNIPKPATQNLREAMQRMSMQQNRQTVMGPSAVGARGNPLGQTPWADPSKYVAATFYVYESDTVNVAPNQTAPLSFNVAQDSDFFWTKFCAFALVGSTATTRSADQLPAVTALIINTTT